MHDAIDIYEILMFNSIFIILCLLLYLLFTSYLLFSSSLDSFIIK